MQRTKKVFILGDFNINVLNYNDHQPTNDFLDSLISDSFIPYILHLELLIIQKLSLTIYFPIFIPPDIIPGNISATISQTSKQSLT